LHESPETKGFARLPILLILDRLQSDVLQEVLAKAEGLHYHLERMAELTCVGQVRQQGLMAGIELVQDRITKMPFPARQRTGARACRMARERGVLLRPLGDVVVMPPLVIDLSLLDHLCEVLYNCLDELSAHR
jgi:adenosylmethionine-8-amino-7-oxononanoate aminotransferase